MKIFNPKVIATLLLSIPFMLAAILSSVWPVTGANAAYVYSEWYSGSDALNDIRAMRQEISEMHQEIKELKCILQDCPQPIPSQSPPKTNPDWRKMATKYRTPTDDLAPLSNLTPTVVETPITSPDPVGK